MSQLLFPLAVLPQRVHDPAALERASQALDEGAGDGPDEDALGSGLHARTGAFLDFKLFAEPAWDDNLGLYREADRVRLGCCLRA